MPAVAIQTTLKRLLGVSTIDVPPGPGTVEELLRACEAEAGVQILPHILTSDGDLVQGVMLLLNGKNIMVQKGLQTPIQPSDILYVFPPAGGG